MIQLERLTKRFDGVEALRGLDLTIESGSFNYLTGHSGAGKSTLIRLLLRLDLATRGRIVVDGVDLAKMSQRQVPGYRRGIGSVFQEHHLLAGRTVLENVAIPLEVLGLRARKQQRQARAALGLVGLAGREHAYPPQLSLGEQQRVGIARAVVNRPKLLLADEPTGNLDPALSREVVKLFDRFREIGATIIIATHDLELLDVVPGREIRLAAGTVESVIEARQAIGAEGVNVMHGDARAVPVTSSDATGSARDHTHDGGSVTDDGTEDPLPAVVQEAAPSEYPAAGVEGSTRRDALSDP